MSRPPARRASQVRRSASLRRASPSRGTRSRRPRRATDPPSPPGTRPGASAFNAAIAPSTSAWVTRANSWRRPPEVASGLVTLRKIEFSPLGTTTIVFGLDVAIRSARHGGHLDARRGREDLEPDELGPWHRDGHGGPEPDARARSHDAPRRDAVRAGGVEVLEPDRAGRLGHGHALAGRIERVVHGDRDRDGRGRDDTRGGIGLGRVGIGNDRDLDRPDRLRARVSPRSLPPAGPGTRRHPR